MILFEGTVTQHGTMESMLFAQYLSSRGIMPGIKVDTRLQPLPASPRKTNTTGLDTLAERCARARENGPVFTKWRAALRIVEEVELPCDEAIELNADELA